MINILEDVTIEKELIEAKITQQATQMNGTVASLASEFANYYFNNTILWSGGLRSTSDQPILNDCMKLDMLIKNYPAELCAAIILVFPESIKLKAFNHLKSLDKEEGDIYTNTRDVGSHTYPIDRDKTAEVGICILNLLSASEGLTFYKSLSNVAVAQLKKAKLRLANILNLKSKGDIKAEMVLIPAGIFALGTSNEQADEIINIFGNWQKAYFLRETPSRKVFLSSFYIDKYPVTNAGYKKFIDETGHPVPHKSSPLARPFNWNRDTKMFPVGKGDHPVVMIDWHEAHAYAEWAGKRLPTEAEWEKAARGTDGRIWPWGNEWMSDCCNHGINGAKGTTPVNTFEKWASPYGVVDLAGNVWEWCDDEFDEKYHSITSNENPRGTGQGKVIRGGCWYDETPELYRCAVRDCVIADAWEIYRGFRCAKSE